MSPNPSLELVCPAGSLPALKAAVDNGADCVYLGFRDNTNARAFAGLNFDLAGAREAVRYAHAKGRKVLLALNTFPQPATFGRWQQAVDNAVEVGVDAVILADAGLMRYASSTHPKLRLHLSVQGSATSYEAINFYREHFGIQRAVLPRVLSLPQVEHVVQNTPVEIELFGFGGLCVMVEGRCLLSSYCTGESPNTAGRVLAGQGGAVADTPTGLESRLNGVLLDRYGKTKRPAIRPCARAASRSAAKPITPSRSPPASTPSTCCPEMLQDRHRRHQDRGPPAQPGLRRAGDESVARRHRRRQEECRRLQTRARLEGRTQQTVRRQQSQPSAPTTGRGNDHEARPRTHPLLLAQGNPGRVL